MSTKLTDEEIQRYLDVIDDMMRKSDGDRLVYNLSRLIFSDEPSENKQGAELLGKYVQWCATKEERSDHKLDLDGAEKLLERLKREEERLKSGGKQLEHPHRHGEKKLKILEITRDFVIAEGRMPTGPEVADTVVKGSELVEIQKTDEVEAGDEKQEYYRWDDGSFWVWREKKSSVNAKERKKGAWEPENIHKTLQDVATRVEAKKRKELKQRQIGELREQSGL